MVSDTSTKPTHTPFNCTAFGSHDIFEKFPTLALENLPFTRLDGAGRNLRKPRVRGGLPLGKIPSHRIRNSSGILVITNMRTQGVLSGFKTIFKLKSPFLRQGTYFSNKVLIPFGITNPKPKIGRI